MAPPEGSDTTKAAVVLVESRFVREKLVDILQRGGYSVCIVPCESTSASLGLVEIPGGPEVAILYSAGVKLIGVNAADRRVSRPAWPFEELIHDNMSAEEILQRCNDVFFRGRGIRRHRRLAIEMEVKAITTGRALLTTTVNFSRGGCFIRSLNPFIEGSPVVLHNVAFTLLGEIRGQVIYTLRPMGDFIARPDKPQEPIIAHPGMAVEFSSGQEETIDGWMTYAEQLSSVKAFPFS